MAARAHYITKEIVLLRPRPDKAKIQEERGKRGVARSSIKKRRTDSLSLSPLDGLLTLWPDYVYCPSKGTLNAFEYRSYSGMNGYHNICDPKKLSIPLIWSLCLLFSVQSWHAFDRVEWIPPCFCPTATSTHFLLLRLLFGCCCCFFFFPLSRDG